MRGNDGLALKLPFDSRTFGMGSRTYFGMGRRITAFSANEASPTLPLILYRIAGFRATLHHRSGVV